MSKLATELVYPDDYVEAPLIGSLSDYHKIQQTLDEYIVSISEYGKFLSADQRKILKRLSGNFEEQKLTIDQVQQQYQLVKKIQSQIVDQDCRLLDGVDVRTIAALVSSINSLISLFLKSSAQMDYQKEFADFKEAVIHAIDSLDEPTRNKFYAKMLENNGE